MDYTAARTIWDAQVNQSPAEFLRECKIDELSRGFPAIARDFVQFYVRTGDYSGFTAEALEDIEEAIAVVLDHESLIG